MGTGHGILGDRHGYAEDGSGGLIRRARLYQIFAAIGFAGRWRRVYDDLVILGGARPGEAILDVSCGTGYLTRQVASIDVVVQPGHPPPAAARPAALREMWRVLRTGRTRS